MSNYSAGPWSVEDYPRGIAESIYVHDATGTDIARVQRSDEAMANARLIAAAPDLLAALRALYQWTTDHVDSDSDVLGALEDRARALLARVDGAEGSGPVPVRTVQGTEDVCPECKYMGGHTAVCSQGRD